MACPRILKEGAASLPRRKWRFVAGETGVENERKREREKECEMHKHVRTYI